MSSIGPLSPPPVAPIVNPVMWAAELPANRPQMHTLNEVLSTQLPHGIRAHMVAAGHSNSTPAGGAAAVVTSIDIKERAAAAHDMTFHPTSEASGARLDPHDPWAPFGATAKDEEGQPLTELTGPEDDPYGVAVIVPAPASSVVDRSGVVGDGSVVAAEVALEAIHGGGDGSGGDVDAIAKVAPPDS